MDKNRFYKFLYNNYLHQTILKVGNKINTYKSKREFDVDFEEQWNKANIKKRGRDWENAYEKLDEKIEMGELLDTLDVLKADSSERTKNKKPVYRVVAVALASVILFITAFAVFQLNRSSEQPLLNITKTTSAGQRLTVVLDDGTQVVMNSDSRLTFPEKFNGNHREVMLEGEAYFEVAHNKEKPFIVNSGDLTTTALGTSFSVCAYKGDKEYKVSLVTGKVKVEQIGEQKNSLVLNPGEKASFEKNTQTLNKSEFDFLTELSWKEGVIYFDRADFDHIRNTLERWYGVRFMITGNPDQQQWEFSGKFKNESLGNILQVLDFAYDFDYKVQDKIVSLKFDKNGGSGKQ